SLLGNVIQFQVQYVVTRNNADDPAVLFHEHSRTALQSPGHFAGTCIHVNRGKTRFHHFSNRRLEQLAIAHHFRQHSIFTQRANAFPFSKNWYLREPEFTHLPESNAYTVSRQNENKLLCRLRFLRPANQPRRNLLRLEQSLFFEPLV